MTVTRKARTTAAGAAFLLVLAGCGGGGDDGDNAGGPTGSPSPGPVNQAASTVEFAIDDDATGPAPEIADAVEGGTIKVLDLNDITHLDPARIYVNTYQNVSQLITRTLTGYRQQAGKVTLVGDLATNTGVTKDGGKTWTFKLRDDITYQDGSQIVAKDIKYGIERGFVPDYSEGPSYLQEWLADSTDFRKEYKGPYEDGSLDALEAPDKKTLIFKFKRPRPDLPFAAALPLAAPVKESKDTKARYDLIPFASGPYKVTEHKRDKSLVLEKNDEWEADSDPIRYQFADRYEFEFGSQPLAINQRLVAANGSDARAVTASGVSPELLSRVTSTPELRERTVSGYTQFVLQYVINTRRIPDLEVRKALLYAFPKQQMRQIIGGPTAGDFATTISSPTLVGHETYDLYDVPPEGDPARARAALESVDKVGQSIVYAYPRTDRQEQLAVAVQQALEKAGFSYVGKPITSATYYDEVGKIDNSFDLFFGGWGADWPSGSTVYPVLLDGRRIADGANNLSQFNDDAVNDRMDSILEITDPEEAGRAWAELDRTIMEQVPQIPWLYDKAFHLHGPRVGGAALDGVLGLISLNGLYVKP